MQSRDSRGTGAERFDSVPWLGPPDGSISGIVPSHFGAHSRPILGLILGTFLGTFWTAFVILFGAHFGSISGAPGELPWVHFIVKTIRWRGPRRG